jgi:hypothetical protein
MLSFKEIFEKDRVILLNYLEILLNKFEVDKILLYEFLILN